MRFLFILLLSFLSACSSLHHSRPEKTLSLDVPATFKVATTGSHKKISTNWISSFGDPRLKALVKEALANNHNLQQAASSLRSAKQSAIIGRARRLPDITASTGANANYSEISNSSSESYNLTLSTNWEPDLWGRLRNLEKASYYDFESAVADFRAARLSLAANTAQSWFNLITAQQQVILAETTLESFQKNLRIIERGYTAGLNNVRDLDVAFGRNNVASAQRNLLSRKLARDNAARVLETLLGRYPSAEIKAITSLPELSRNTPAGIPSDLIARRPDMVSAQSRIYASFERSEAARKNLLPDLRLTGSASPASSSSFSRLFDPNFLLYSAAASLSQTVYRGGQINAQTRQALESNRQALESFAQSALNAFLEVESALATDISLAKQESFLINEVDQAGLAEKFAERSYTEGIEGVNILSVLEAQRRANGARASLIALRNSRLQNRVDLYLALGGGF